MNATLLHLLSATPSREEVGRVLQNTGLRISIDRDALAADLWGVAMLLHHRPLKPDMTQRAGAKVIGAAAKKFLDTLHEQGSSLQCGVENAGERRELVNLLVSAARVTEQLIAESARILAANARCELTHPDKGTRFILSSAIFLEGNYRRAIG